MYLGLEINVFLLFLEDTLLFRKSMGTQCYLFLYRCISGAVSCAQYHILK